MDACNSFEGFPARGAVAVPAADPVVAALDTLRRRFPTVCLWFGASTRHWWAYMNGHLIEAFTPEELGHRIDLANTGMRRYDVEGASDRPSPGEAPIPPPARAGTRPGRGL